MQLRSRHALLLMFTSIIMIAGMFAPSAHSQTNPPSPAYPAPETPTSIPIEPTPSPDLSSEAQQALDFVAKQEKLSPESLSVVNEFPADAPILSKKFQAVTIIEQQRGQIFKVLVDRQNGAAAYREQVDAEREKISQAKYGKFQPALYERLQQLQDTDVITVAVIAAAAPGQSIAEQSQAAAQALAAKYPEARAALQKGGKPMDVPDTALANRIRDEYATLVQTSAKQQVQPLADALTAMGLRTSKPMAAPMLWVTASKKEIERLAQRGDVAALLLGESGPGQPTLDTAPKTNRAPAVWRRGYDGTGSGSGVKIAIVDDTNVDFTSNSSNCPAASNNCFRRPGASRLSMNGLTSDHATFSASAAASDHPIYKGMAPGAQILSAGMTDSNNDLSAAYAVEWALQNGAQIINTSYGWCYYGAYEAMNPLDFFYDYFARSNFRLFTVAAGNDNTCTGIPPNDFVTTPGKAWNVLTVGAYNDQNNADWLLDNMSSFSKYGNPASPHGDHEKPEIVAPGEGLAGIGLDGNPVPILKNGTSFAAPQVAGLGALLIHRNSSLSSWPEASRAIIMATADHALEVGGYDRHSGVGGINADLADSAASVRGTSSASNPCTGPCWWGDSLTSSSFDANGYRYYYFNATAGDRARFAISWWSNPGCSSGWFSCSSDQLSTDLDLVIFKPDGTQLGGATSSSWDNNYEVTARDGTIMLPQTGTYRIGVYRKSFNETANHVGVAWTRLPAVAGTYDDNNSAVAYSGVWQSAYAPLTTLARAANNTITYSNSGGSTARFSFNGTRISYRHTMTYNRGGYRVYIDGEQKGIFSAYTPETRWQAVKTWGLENGDHTIEVVADGGGYVDVDSFVVDTPYLWSGNCGSCDDAQTSWIQYIGRYGEWSASSSFPSAYNSTLHWSTVVNGEAGNAAGTTFYGSQVTYVYTKASNRGKAMITIDGYNYGYVDLYSSSTQWQQSSTFNLSPGYHTIHVGVSGQSSASDYYIDLDRFIVQ